MIHRAFAIGLVGALLSSCATAPEYSKPDVAPPPTFRGEAGPSAAGSFADQPWQSVFTDPALADLITQALERNYDLQVAVARIDQARAQVDAISAQSRPQLGYEAVASGEKVAITGERDVTTTTVGGVGGLIDAAWELDVWGRIRRSTDAARANLMAQEDVRRGVLLTLVSEVAGGYFRLIELDQELAIAQDSTRAYRNTADLFNTRFEAGRDSRLPVERAEAAYHESTGRVADLKRAIAIQENALSTLTGAYPGSIPRGRTLKGQQLPATPLGATTDLLQRRPDILEAEQRMIRANAEIGVAVANQFPRIGLSAFLGGKALNLVGGWQGLGTWNLALSALGPIYDGGRLRAIYREREAFWDQTVAEYKKAALVAFQETSDALAAEQNLIPRRAALEAQVEASRQSVELAMLRYESGRSSYFEVLEAQQQLYPALDQLAQVERDQLLAAVNLYKALGGGWTSSPAETPARTAQLR